MDEAPEYSISAILYSVAAEWSIGIELRATTEPTMVASRSVQPPLLKMFNK